MSRRLRQRLMQTCVLAVVVAIGVWGYQNMTAPERRLLVGLAEERLEAIFAPAQIEFAEMMETTEEGVQPSEIEIDLVRGVTLKEFKLLGSDREVLLQATRVFIEHDLIDLASGRYRPGRIRIEGARLYARETEDGIDLGFGLDLDQEGGKATVPVIEIVDGRVEIQAREDTQRFHDETVVIRLVDVQISLTPALNDEIRIKGSFRTEGLGQSGPPIGIHGAGWPRTGRVVVGVEAKAIEVNEELLAALNSDVAKRLRDSGVKGGDLVVSLSREPDVDAGAVQSEIRWQAQELPLKHLASLPGAENISIESVEQLDALFASAGLTVEIREGGINVSSFVHLLGGGTLDGQARLNAEGEIQSVNVNIRGAQIDAEEIQRALGEGGRKIAEAFRPSGEVTAQFNLDTLPDGTLDWSVDALLENAELSYFGLPDEDGKPTGFPYGMEAATGTVRITPGRVELSDIQGTHGFATVRILGLKDAEGNVQQRWTGEGETGRILITEDGPDIALTVQGERIEVDSDLRDAIDNSEFAGLLEEYQVEGTIERLAVDIVSLPGIDDKAVAEVRLDFEDERFRYRDFPLQMEKVTGWVELRRPLLEDRSRGRTLAFDATGRVDDAEVHVAARIVDHEDRGRLRVTANDFPLEGQLSETIAKAEATKGGLDAVWRYLAPSGRADVVAELPLSDDPDPLRMSVTLKDATIRLDAEDAPHPLRVEHLGGDIDVVDDRITLSGLEGTFQGTPVKVAGFVDGGTDGEWELDVQTLEPLVLTEELLAALPHYLGEASFLPHGMELEHGGRLILSIRLHRAPGEDEKLTAEVNATSIEARLRLPEGTAVDVTGQGLEVVGSDVRLHGLRATAPGMTVDVEQVAVEGGGIQGTLRLGLDEFEATQDILGLVPESARASVASVLENRVLTTPDLEVTTLEDGTVRIQGELVVLPPKGEEPGDSPRGTIVAMPIEIRPGGDDEPSTVTGRARLASFSLGGIAPLDEIDGEVDLRRLTLGDEVDGDFTVRLQKARLLDLRIRDLTIPVRWDAGILRTEAVVGRLAEGALRARFVAHTREPAAYEGELTLDHFDVSALAEDLAEAGEDFQGRGRLRVEFQNRSGAAEDLVAVGRLRVEDGDLGDLPGVTNIFTLFDAARGAENPPKFERAFADFTVRGDVIDFRRLQLSGPLFDLPGRGTVDLDGTADLLFTPDILKGFLLPGVMQLPGVGKVVGTILPERVLYVVRLRGDLETAEPEIVALPVLGGGRREPPDRPDAPETPPRRIPRWFR